MQRIVVIKWKTDRKIVTAAKQYRARNVMHFGIVATLTYPYQQCFLRITLFTVLPYSRIRHVWVAWNMLRYTRISERDTRSLTKQKFMDSAEFSSSFHRIVEHARRRRGRCNSCSTLHFKAGSWIKIAACDGEPFIDRPYSRMRTQQCKTRERTALLNVPMIKKNSHSTRRTYCRWHANESAPPSSMTFIVEIRGRDSDKRARWMHGDRFSRARTHRSREKNELNTVRVGKIRRVIYDLIRCGWN